MRGYRVCFGWKADVSARVPGTAIFLTATPDATPHALLHNLKHNKVLHERVVFLTAEVTEEPWVQSEDRVKVSELGNGCWRMTLRYGFMNVPDIARSLRYAKPLGLDRPIHIFFLTGRDGGPGRGGERHGAVAREAVRDDVAQRW